MEFSIDNQVKANIITLNGRLDAVTAPQFEQDIADYLSAPANNLVLDFTDLDYISSAGLRVILKVAKVFKMSEFDFTVCQVQDHVNEVLEMSGFEHFITIKNSVADCIG